jgi:PAS domain S-box-containing protein
MRQSRRQTTAPPEAVSNDISDRRYRLLAEQLPGVAYVEALKSSSAMYISPRIEHLTGYRAEDWIGDPNFFERVLHPEDRARVIAAFTEARARLEPIVCEYRIVRPDNTIVWVNDDARIAYDEDGAELFIQGYMTDVTARKATERKLDEAREHFRSLAEQLPLVSYVDDPGPEGRSMYVSPQIMELVGITAEQWIADEGTFARTLHPDDRAEVLARTGRCRQEGLPFESEYRLVTTTGETVWVHDAAVPVGDPDAPRYWQGYVIDITERKEADAQRERLLELERAQNEQLRELDVMKDEFVALVSHELRTPLTAIQGYTELVLDGTTGELNDEQRAALTSVDRSSARLFRLINDLLFVAQVNAGKLNVAIEDVDLVEIASEAVADARPRAAAAQVALEFECTLTPTVRADRVRLAQVFDNLISNAIKFTPPGGRVGLSVSMVGEEAMIVVADSGMGITPEDQQRLFTRFFRTKAAAKIEGTGLGLSITKAILDAHHGSISVESELGHGTRFTVTVPTSEHAPVEHRRRSTDTPAAIV